MKDYSTRVELMAIPIVAVLGGIGLVLALAADAGAWAWLFVVAALIAVGVLLVARVRTAQPTSGRSSTPHPVGRAPAAAVNGVYRVLVIADESCVDPAFPAQLADHAAGRTVEALVIAPAIGSRLARWTGDESQHADARRHLDETVAALAAAGIPATGERAPTTRCRRPTTASREFSPHEIVFVTKPGTGTDWVEQGVVEAARERYAVPGLPHHPPRRLRTARSAASQARWRGETSRLRRPGPLRPRRGLHARRRSPSTSAARRPRC